MSAYWLAGCFCVPQPHFTEYFGDSVTLVSERPQKRKMYSSRLRC